MFDERLFGIPWSVLALIALGVAVIYVFVDTSGGASGVRWFILRWMHSLCWLMLAGAALAASKATPLPAQAAGPLGIAGALLYAVFVVTMLTSRS